MFTRNAERIALPVTFVLAVTTILPLAAQQPNEAETTSPEALTSYSGGAVKAKRALTQTTAYSLTTINTWVTLPSSTISYYVAAYTTDLFNVSFSAECAKFGGSYLRIRILDNGVPLQPYDGFQVFCSSAGYATHKGNWVRRVPASTVGVWHYLTVQFFQTVPSASIDDWTFELVVYD